jgi:pilus assembly protein TadC
MGGAPVFLALADAVLWLASGVSPSGRPASRRLADYCRARSEAAWTVRGRSQAVRRRGRPAVRQMPRRAGSRRELRALRHAFPDALDTLAICLRAGLGLHAAVAEYAKIAPGAAGDAFRAYLNDLAVGRPPDDALESLARRYPIDEVAATAAAVAQSLRLGTPLADVFEAQAAHCRTLALHRAREAAQKLSTQLVLPLVVFIFPVVFIIGLGPIALKVGRLVGLLQ